MTVDRSGAANPSASDARTASKQVRKACSNGWPVPASVANDKAAVSSISRSRPPMPPVSLSAWANGRRRGTRAAWPSSCLRGSQHAGEVVGVEELWRGHRPCVEAYEGVHRRLASGDGTEQVLHVWRRRGEGGEVWG